MHFEKIKVKEGYAEMSVQQTKEVN